jgi:transposase-like protein
MKKQKDSSVLDQLPTDFFKQFKSGQDFHGFMDALFKRGVESLLESELDAHMGYDKHHQSDNPNSRNGSTQKTIKTSKGTYRIDVPRDREGSFEPRLVPKRKRMIDTIEDAVISLYAKGMSTEDISCQINELYGVSVSGSTVSNITERILIDVEQWQNRALDSVYLIVWLDGIVFKVRQDGRIVNKAVHIICGLNTQGRKEVLGLWISENESAAFWTHALTDLRARGVEDILIACSDNLKGLTRAVKAVFPDTVTQLCIVHQIRNSLRYVPAKNRKEVAKDLRAIYEASNEDQALKGAVAFEDKWAARYPYICKSWKDNWDNLAPFLNYPLEIRKLIYTTNIIENLNRCVRKFTKNKSMFPDDRSVIKAVYLAVQNVSKVWTRQIPAWPTIASQFLILYPDRCRISI